MVWASTCDREIASSVHFPAGALPGAFAWFAVFLNCTLYKNTIKLLLIHFKLLPNANLQFSQLSNQLQTIDSETVPVSRQIKISFHST